MACAAFGCTNRSSKKIPGVTFHKFPKNEPLRTAWILSVRRANWSPSHCSTLCSDHFEEIDFDRTSPFRVFLKPNVVPSIFKGFPKHLQKDKRPIFQYLQSADEAKDDLVLKSPPLHKTENVQRQQPHKDGGEQLSSVETCSDEEIDDPFNLVDVSPSEHQTENVQNQQKDGNEHPSPIHIPTDEEKDIPAILVHESPSTHKTGNVQMQQPHKNGGEQLSSDQICGVDEKTDDPLDIIHNSPSQHQTKNIQNQESLKGGGAEFLPVVHTCADEKKYVPVILVHVSSTPHQKENVKIPQAFKDENEQHVPTLVEVIQLKRKLEKAEATIQKYRKKIKLLQQEIRRNHRRTINEIFNS